MLEKNIQDLQKPKYTPKALSIPSKSITPAKRHEVKPETKVGNESSKGIRLAMNTEEPETQDDNNCNKHEKKTEEPESVFQVFM
ncbi:hypothetical protein G9A89_003167 [Geosiphon pyriformis]|nr:hypothetical protein G9A89_003167 [Geosiphon pyriformis]